MKNIMKTVKKDYEKRSNNAYDLLYKFYGLIPAEYRDKIEYKEFANVLWFNGKMIGDLKNIAEITTGNNNRIIKCIYLIKADFTNVGMESSLMNIVFHLNEDNNKYDCKISDWKIDHITNKDMTALEQFEDWFAWYKGSNETIIINNKQIPIKQFEFFVYDSSDNLKITYAEPIGRYEWKLKDENMDREFNVTDSIDCDLEDDEELTPVGEGEMPF